MTFLNKRGQMTLFIIAGVVILFAAFFIGYLQNEGFRQRVESQLFGAAVVPEQAKGVVSYINNCVGDATEEGITILGSKGGYIDLPLHIRPNSRAVLNVASLKIPYWLYGESNLNVPSEDDMELSLRNYISRQFNDRCSLEFFEEDGYIFNNDRLNFDVEINDDEVIVKLFSDLSVEIKGQSFDIKNYISVTSNKPVGRLWNIARKILERELKTKPFEFNTLNLISTYDNDKEFLPPIGAFDFKCGGRKWNYNLVKDNLKSAISSYVPYLRVEGAKNEKDFSDKFYKSMIINRIETNLNDVNVGFSYFADWPFFFDISPREGQNIKAGGLNFNAPFFGLLCTNFYNFRYTVLYPALVELEKDEYRFVFPIEVYLVDNYGRRNLFADNVIDVNLENPEKSLFCDEDQKLSSEVDILVKDGLSDDNLDGVDVSYSCGLNRCTVGVTKDGNLKDSFPLCKGGELVLKKEGYAEHKERFDAVLDTKINRLIELEPFRNKKISVKVLDVDENNNIIGERDLASDEKVFLQLSKVNVDLLGYDFQEALIISGIEKKDIEIVPGDYSIDAQLQLDRKISLPREEVEGEIFEGSEIESLFTGGAKVDSFFLRKENLDANNEIVFFVVSYGAPKKLSDVSRSFNLEGFDLEPKLI